MDLWEQEGCQLCGGENRLVFQELMRGSGIRVQEKNGSRAINVMQGSGMGRGGACPAPTILARSMLWNEHDLRIEDPSQNLALALHLNPDAIPARLREFIRK